VHETSVDECACLGLGGFQCGNAFRDEKDPVVQRYMLRMVEAQARLSRDEFEREWYTSGRGPGMPHAEAAMFCKQSGPCGGKNADGNDLDGGYSCLTAADSLYAGTKGGDPTGIERVKRACSCDLANARIPVMGGYGLLACDEAGKPKVFGTTDLALAKEIRACAECNPETGRKACQAEIDRLWTTDEKLARYLAEEHAPRCRKPPPG
jgi:hypothetical protein